jgi:hypothetical protein
MNIYQFQRLKERIQDAGYNREIALVEKRKPVSKSWDFAIEYVYVVINSGMKNQIAEKIYQKVMSALLIDKLASTVFGHKPKCKAIDEVWMNREKYFREYYQADDKIQYLSTLPWIGSITKYHLARNLGIDTVKPDRHLVRIAGIENKQPFELCKELSDATGYRVGTVDVILWRAANLGYI